MSAADFISSIAWPLTALIIALLFRRPLSEALRSAGGALSAGPFRMEWQRQAEAVESDLSRAPSVARDETGAVATRLDEIAESNPKEAIEEALRQIEVPLRALLEEDGEKDIHPSTTVRRLAADAEGRGLIAQDTEAAIEGLTVMRKLAVHSEEELSPRYAHEFVALSQAVLYTISTKARSAARPTAAPGSEDG